MHAELQDYGFTVVTVALDKSPDDPRPFIANLPGVTSNLAVLDDAAAGTGGAAGVV